MTACGSAIYAGQFLGELPDKERFPGSPGWGLGNRADVITTCKLTCLKTLAIGRSRPKNGPKHHRTSETEG